MNILEKHMNLFIMMPINENHLTLVYLSLQNVLKLASDNAIASHYVTGRE